MEKCETTDLMMAPMVKEPEWKVVQMAAQWRWRWRQASRLPEGLEATAARTEWTS